MVQFIKGAADPRDAVYSALGEALGGGLSKGVLSHYANKAVDKVLDNPEYADLPESKKRNLLQKALSPFGEPGREVFKNRSENEQLSQQEKQEKLQKEQSAVFGKLLNNKEVSQKEMDILTPEQSLAWAKHKQALEIAQLKSTGKLTQASQPIHPDQLNKIQEVRRTPEYQSADPAKKTEMLKDNGVSKENADSEVKPYLEAEKNKPGGEYGKLREKAISELVSESFEARNKAEDLSDTINQARQAISGDITGPGLEAVIKKNPYGQLMLGLTVDESKLETLNKKMLEGTKGLFGPKPTENEIFLLLNGMLPARGKSKEANMASLDILSKANDLVKIKGDLISEITRGGKDYVPDLEEQLNKKMRPLMHKFISQVEEAREKYSEQETKDEVSGRFKAPDGSIWKMTEAQVQAAKAKGVNFEPAK